ncbi:FU domain containing [Micractinium conductrix]|nr:FU domain containing [Micractinium conductrix]|eukprot:PSC69914.1 FU domain containing [Micractinium conductrix]
MRYVVVFVALLLAVAGASAHKCVPNKNNCEKCNPSRSKCLSCYDQYSVNRKGQCVECKVPGDLGWTCVKCKGDKPSFCLECNDWEGEQPTGVYATHSGRCKYCPDKHCDSCDSISGKCRECRRGFGLVHGKCKKCGDEECISCNKNANKCTLCYSGNMVNKAGKCVKCADPSCVSCPKDPKVCTECPWVKPVGGKCPPNPHA